MTAGTDGPPFVTVVIPCRNEREHIRSCLESVLANTYPPDRVEVLVVDGMSTDGSREIVAEIAARDTRIRLIDNPQSVTPVALNIGIGEARGDVIVRMDAHTLYPPQYLETLVRYQQETGADNVGTAIRMVPSSPTPVGEAIAAALNHPFGGGVAAYRIGPPQEPQWVDTVPFGCFRRDVFARVGLFDEVLARSQDMEFNLRLRAAGGRILLVPGIESTYLARAGFFRSCAQNFRNGFWVFYPMTTGRTAWRFRHLVPFLFVLSLLTLAGASLIEARFRYPLGVLLAAYAGVLASAGLHIAATRQRWEMLILAPVVLAALHVGYGLGSVSGLVAAAATRGFWRRLPQLLRRHLRAHPR